MNWFNIIKDDEDDIHTYDVDEDYHISNTWDGDERVDHKWPGLEQHSDVDLPVGSQYGNNQFLEVLAASVEEQSKFETMKSTIETTRKRIYTLKAQETKLRENLEAITQRIRDIPPEDKRNRKNLQNQRSRRVGIIKRIRGEINSMLTDDYKKNLLDLQRHEALSDPVQLPKIARKYGWELPKELDNMLAQLRIQHGVSPKAFEQIRATIGGDKEKRCYSRRLAARQRDQLAVYFDGRGTDVGPDLRKPGRPGFLHRSGPGGGRGQTRHPDPKHRVAGVGRHPAWLGHRHEHPGSGDGRLPGLYPPRRQLRHRRHLHRTILECLQHQVLPD